MCPPICLTSQQFTDKAQFHLQSAMMKEHLETPKHEGDEIFYQQNQFNKITTLIHFQNNKKFKKCDKFYPCRYGKCFPGAAPIGCPPLRHRPANSSRPNEKNDVKIPDRMDVFKTYTRKLKIRVVEDD